MRKQNKEIESIKTIMKIKTKMKNCINLIDINFESFAFSNKKEFDIVYSLRVINTFIQDCQDILKEED